MNNISYNPSNSEKKVFYELSLLESGLTPKAQYSVGPYSIDIAFPKEKIAIEIDGEHHRKEAQIIKDGNKDEYLKSHGWKVLRFPAEEAHHNPKKMATEIQEFINDSKPKNSLWNILWNGGLGK